MLGTIRVNSNWDYDKLKEIADNHRTLRLMLGHIAWEDEYVYPIQTMVADLPKLVVAVSPIIAGKAVKGPAAKMMGEMGMEVSSGAVAGYYGDLVDVFVFDERDSALLNQEGGLKSLVEFQTDTLMQNRNDRSRLARQIIEFSLELLHK